MAKIKITKELKAQAKKVGLDKIEYGYYNLIKTGEKRASPYGYPAQFLANRGVVSVIGNKEAVGIFIQNTQDWFKTSAVLSCKEVEDGYAFETLNSFYKLERING